jgi:mRNA interferase YafQ
MFFLKYSSRFKKDLKYFQNNKDLLSIIEKVLDILVSGRRLPEKFRNHQLKGEFKGCFECHLKSDILLIYKKDRDEMLILLLRIGTHSDLF